MANLFLDQIKKQASSFLHEKFKNARLVFTDVTAAELLAEEATNNDPCSPDAKTMTRIADASYEVDDYWRIVDVLHRRLYNNDWKLWRQSYKALVLLDFLLTHGPEEFAEEFLCDIYVIKELSTFEHKDEKGFDWGVQVQKKSEGILELLKGGETLKQARLKALRITNEIQGFGNLMNIISPTSSSPSPSPSSSRTSSSLGSYSTSTTTSSTWINDHLDVLSKYEIDDDDEKPSTGYLNGRSHIWDCCTPPPTEEKGCLLGDEDEDDEDIDRDDEKRWPCPGGLLSGIRSKLVGVQPDFKSL